MCPSTDKCEGRCTCSAVRALPFDSVRLHPLHSGEAPGPGLVPLRTDLDISCIPQWEEDREHSAAGDTEDPQHESERNGEEATATTQVHHRVSFNGQCIRVTELSGRRPKMLLEVPLLLAEVSEIKGARWPIISISGSPETWLFQVVGSEAEAATVLDLIIGAGAVRSTLPPSWRLHSAPIADTGMYHVMARRRPEVSDSPETTSMDQLCCKVFADSPTEVASLRHEVALLVAAQRHPNLVRFRGLFRCRWSGGGTLELETSGAEAAKERHEAALGMLIDHGNFLPCSLLNVLVQKRYSEGDAKVLACGLLSGLAHLHRAGVVHRGVKPENVLLASCGRPQLTNFKNSTWMWDSASLSMKVGSPGFVSPEVLQRHYVLAGDKLDTFSLGVLLFLALSGTMPFPGSSLASVCKRTIRCKVDFSISSRISATSSRCRMALLHLLSRDPAERCSAAEALNSSWITGVAGSDKLLAQGDSQALSSSWTTGISDTKTPCDSQIFSNSLIAELADEAFSSAPSATQAGRLRDETEKGSEGGGGSQDAAVPKEVRQVAQVRQPKHGGRAAFRRRLLGKDKERCLFASELAADMGGAGAVVGAANAVVTSSVPSPSQPRPKDYANFRRRLRPKLGSDPKLASQVESIAAAPLTRWTASAAEGWGISDTSCSDAGGFEDETPQSSAFPTMEEINGLQQSNAPQQKCVKFAPGHSCVEPPAPPPKDHSSSFRRRHRPQIETKVAGMQPSYFPSPTNAKGPRSSDYLPSHMPGKSSFRSQFGTMEVPEAAKHGDFSESVVGVCAEGRCGNGASASSTDFEDAIPAPRQLRSFSFSADEENAFDNGFNEACTDADENICRLTPNRPPIEGAAAQRYAATPSSIPRALRNSGAYFGSGFARRLFSGRAVSDADRATSSGP